VASAFGSENRLIAIEQPELHVHPALQTELADLFIQSAKERGNRFLIETHSEHLILRVMKRIRQTFEGKLPEGKPPITPDDVCILYVEPGEDGSIVREMPLNERGELIKGWPGGFFEEALNEMF
jgi:predicted ATPase